MMGEAVVPDDDEVPVPEMIAPKAYKDLQRGLTNDAIWRQQMRTANIASQQQPTQQVLNLVTTLTSALAGIGSVSTSCQGAGGGPIFISLSPAQATALITKLTLGILG